MQSFVALAGFSLLLATLVSSPTTMHHEHSGPAHGQDSPRSVLALVFDMEGEAPSLEAALAAIPGSKSDESADEPGLWSMILPEGTLMLNRIPYGAPTDLLLPGDQVRFTKPELARLEGERLTLSLLTDIADGGLPRLHTQIRDVVAAADSLGLKDPIALFDYSGHRWHPPGWVARMVKSRAGPAPSTVFKIHAVYDEGEDGKKRSWIHSHGIARLSGYEIGCIDVRPEHLEALYDVVELAACFAIDDVDWPAGEPTSVVFGLELARLPWVEGVAALVPLVIGTADDHEADHGGTFVLAVQEDGAWRCPGEAAAALEIMVVGCSTRETERGALAARETYSTMRDWQKGTEVDHQVLVKSPVETEDGGHEHCWFEVSRLRALSVKATLLSQPMGRADIAPGDSASLRVTNLTGWMVQTEAGNFGPDELEALLAASTTAEGE